MYIRYNWGNTRTEIVPCIKSPIGIVYLPIAILANDYLNLDDDDDDDDWYCIDIKSCERKQAQGRKG